MVEFYWKWRWKKTFTPFDFHFEGRMVSNSTVRLHSTIWPHLTVQLRSILHQGCHFRLVRYMWHAKRNCVCCNFLKNLNYMAFISQLGGKIVVNGKNFSCCLNYCDFTCVLSLCLLTIFICFYHVTFIHFLPMKGLLVSFYFIMHESA